MKKRVIKKCKGIRKAAGHGCGNEKEIYIFGLCFECRNKWLYSTKEGGEYLHGISLKAHKKEKSIQEKEKQENLIKLMSCDKYRSKYVQPVINEIARLIDHGQPCIATNKHSGKMNGGHYHSVGSNRTIALNLHNIHIQTMYSNSYRGGDNIKYKEGLIRAYGQEYADYVESLNSIEPIKLSKDDLIRIKETALSIRNDLRKNLLVRSAKERITCREEINKKIGVYSYGYFK